MPIFGFCLMWRIRPSIIFYTGNVKLFDRDDYDYIMSGRVSNTIHVTSRDGYHFSAKELVMNHKDYPAGMSCHIRTPRSLKKGSITIWYWGPGMP